MLIWIIDEEWKDYDVEKKCLKQSIQVLKFVVPLMIMKGSEGIWLSRGRDSCSSVCFHS